MSTDLNGTIDLLVNVNLIQFYLKLSEYGLFQFYIDSKGWGHYKI